MKRSILLVLMSSTLLVGLLLILGVGSVTYAQEPVENTMLCFRRGADVYCTSRPLGLDGDLSERVQRVLEALVAGPTPTERADAVWSAIPQGAGLAEVTVEGGRVSVYLVLPETYFRPTGGASRQDAAPVPFRVDGRSAHPGRFPGRPHDRACPGPRPLGSGPHLP